MAYTTRNILDRINRQQTKVLSFNLGQNKQKMMQTRAKSLNSRSTTAAFVLASCLFLSAQKAPAHSAGVTLSRKKRGGGLSKGFVMCGSLDDADPQAQTPQEPRTMVKLNICQMGSDDATSSNATFEVEVPEGQRVGLLQRGDALTTQGDSIFSASSPFVVDFFVPGGEEKLSDAVELTRDFLSQHNHTLFALPRLANAVHEGSSVIETLFGEHSTGKTRSGWNRTLIVGVNFATTSVNAVGAEAGVCAPEPVQFCFRLFPDTDSRSYGAAMERWGLDDDDWTFGRRYSIGVRVGAERAGAEETRQRLVEGAEGLWPCSPYRSEEYSLVLEGKDDFEGDWERLLASKGLATWGNMMQLTHEKSNSAQLALEWGGATARLIGRSDCEAD